MTRFARLMTGTAGAALMLVLTTGCEAADIVFASLNLASAIVAAAS